MWTTAFSSLSNHMPCTPECSPTEYSVNVLWQGFVKNFFWNYVILRTAKIVAGMGNNSDNDKCSVIYLYKRYTLLLFLK